MGAVKKKKKKVTFHFLKLFLSKFTEFNPDDLLLVLLTQNCASFGLNIHLQYSFFTPQEL